MKVLMFTWEYPPKVVGGLARHVYDLSAILAKQGIEVIVITCDFPNAPEYEEKDNLRVHRVNCQIPADDFATWAFSMNFRLKKVAHEIAKKEKPDIIHAHDWIVAPAAISIKHCHRIPLIATIHSTEYGRRRGIHEDYQRMIHETEWWLCYESWRIICCSNFMRNEVSSVLGVPYEKIDVIPNGINVEKFFNVNVNPLVKQTFAPNGEKIVLFVGRLVPEKGVNILIGAAPKILSAVPEAKFIVVGNGYMKDRYLYDAHFLGVAHKFHFTDYIDDGTLLQLYKLANVAVFPSLYEPFGIAALEAMAAKIPVVVSDVGGLAEIVDHDYTGYKAYPDNSDSIADGVIKILTDEGYANYIAKNAFKKVREVYNWYRIAEETVSVYERVLDEYKHTDWAKN